jgi:Tol biopolymer transport system component
MLIVSSEEEAMSYRRSLLRLLLTIAACLAAVPSVHAQYFGQNKVQYRTFNFQVLKTEHFDIYYYPEEREAIEHAALIAERWYTRLSKVLMHHFDERQALIMYASHPHFEQTNVIEGALGEGTGGVTEALKRRIVLPFAGPLAETDHVIGHELVHAFQYDIGGADRGNFASPLNQLPLWFIEGQAEYLSLGPVDPNTAMWMREAVQREKLPKIRDLDSGRYFPYRYGQAVWAYIAGRWGDSAVTQILKQGGRTGGGVEAIERVLEIKEEQLTKDWHEALKQAYQVVTEPSQAPPAMRGLIAAAKPASSFAHALITEKQHGGNLNVGPALSPDGKYVVFLSEKGLFSIELYLADAKTGDVIRSLTKTAVDPHYESLQFINSAGAWSADSRRFAFAGISKGSPTLTLVDMPSGRRRQEIKLKELDEIFHPTWSPDGKQVAFSAIVGGLTDLFVYDFEAKKLERLTTDPYADLQPAWSPDGRRIAFVTDRFSTDLKALSYGNYRLAAIDVRTREISALPSFPEAKNINPQWAREGRELYFISDRGGIANVYRQELERNEVYAVTSVVTGVSGITTLSPSLSVAPVSGRVAFSNYEQEGYWIYTLESSEAVGTRVDWDPVPAVAAVLPPRERTQSQVADMLDRPLLGLPEIRDFRATPYRMKLSLDYVAQPTIGVGTDRFGTFVGGGTSLFFSDMLGNHVVQVAVEAQGEFSDFFGEFSGIVGYQNRKSRLNWGVILEQVPLRTGSLAAGPVRLDSGQVAYAEETVIFRETHRLAAGVLSYPLNRVKRLELTAGVRNIAFKTKRQTDFFNPATGEFLGSDEETLPSESGLTFFESSAAFVHDTSIFGATSPIVGERYRLEGSPTSGTLNFTGVLVDYRRYLMPVRPFTLALRAMHYGRYGSGAEDPRFSPLFLGYPSLVRGYEVGSFEAQECGVTLSGRCPVFDQLEGSRLFIANAELRFPLLGVLGGRNFYGPLPIEAAVFADTGVAWTAQQKASFLGGDRDFVSSVGATLRANVLGFMIVEVDYVRPLDRPNRKDWLWQFNFMPGF